MMSKERKVSVYDLEGSVKRTIELPPIFATNYRPDIIKRAVLASRAARRQRFGVNNRAGKKTSAESWGVGRGAARVPRVKGSQHPAGGKAAFAPFTVGGRMTHPPKPEHTFDEKINKKERRLAIRSAISCTANPVLVEARGHILDLVPELPLVVISDFEKLKRTARVTEVFESLGVMPDLDKIKERTGKIRVGKGKRRGRRYKSGTSVLIVINEDKGLVKAARNIKGVDITTVENLSAELLAPGTHAGRLTIWTESALEKLSGEELFN
jgi:large subunit ribosomal protein L4e